MKSARIHAYTQQPADIRIEDVPKPEPGPGQVRVRMRMSPVNPSDLNFVRGTYHQALERIIWNQRRADGDSRVHFDPDRLSDGVAERSETGTTLVSYGCPDSPAVRIIDPQTHRECADGEIGEIWVRGDNVCQGYWNKPEETARTFAGVIVEPTSDTPAESWLCTGDLGFLSDGELFIVGRIKDLLIVRGRNHYPDDIEATINAISGCRSVALVVQGADAEELVAIVETKKRGNTEDEIREHLAQIENSVHSAISESHGIAASELVLVSRGAIPLTTSGKIRRQACVERYVSGAFERVR